MNQPKFLLVETNDVGDTIVAAARAALPEFRDNDRNFVESILGTFDQRVARKVVKPMQRLSGSQWYWLNEKAAQVARQNVPVVRETAALGDLQGVIRLFDVASQHLKKPGITLGVTAVVGRDMDGDVSETTLLRLKPASATARVPGSINVVRQDGVWLGRILREGKFELSSRDKDAAQEVIPALRRFAADPVTGAKESARLTGKCCFCNTGLKDERSTSVGYGPICADHFGLPWGN